MSQPTISVLLPVRNTARYLGACIRSLLRQTLDSFEVIAVDDHSEDDTAAVFEAEAGGDPRFRLVPAAGTGLILALNQAAGLARTSWLARMDGDDLCHPRRLELQLRMALEQPGLALVGSLVRLFPRPLSVGMSRYERWLNSLTTPQQIFEQRYVESPLAHPSVLMRRSEFERLGGYRDRGWPEDYDLWLRMASAGLALAKVPRVLLYWRDWSGRTSRASSQYSPDAFRACKLEHLRRDHPLERGSVILGAGPTGRPWARLMQAHGLPVHCFLEVHPRRIGMRIAGLPVLRYDELPSVGPAVLLAAAGREGAREQILAWFAAHPPGAGQQLVLVA